MSLVVVDADVLGRRRTGDETYVWNRLRELGVARTYGGILAGHAAKALFDLGRWPEARSRADAGLELDPSGPAAAWLHVVRARIDTNQGRFEDAAGHLAAARGLLLRLAAARLGGGTGLDIFVPGDLRQVDLVTPQPAFDLLALTVVPLTVGGDAAIAGDAFRCRFFGDGALTCGLFGCGTFFRYRYGITA